MKKNLLTDRMEYKGSSGGLADDVDEFIRVEMPIEINDQSGNSSFN